MLTDDNFLLQEQLNHSQIENADLNTQMIKMEKERKANLLEKEQIISELNKLKNELEKKEKEILDFLKIQNQKDSTNYGEDFQKVDSLKNKR